MRIAIVFVVCVALYGCALELAPEKKAPRKHKRAPAAARHHPVKQSEIHQFSTVQSDSGQLEEVRQDLTRDMGASNDALERSIKEQREILAR